MNTKKSIALVSTSSLAAGIAHSQVIYSGPLNLQQNYSDTVPYRQGVDMTGDGVNDFTFGYEGVGAQKPYVDTRTAVGTDVPAQSGIVTLLGTGTDGLPLTTYGTTIDATYAAGNPALTAGRGYMYQDANGNVVGGWSNTQITDAYVGIELSLAGGTSYGWLEFIDNPISSPASLTLVQWAYNSTPGVGLPAGVTPTPEPTTLALGGLGTATMLLWRKRKARV